MCPDFGAEAADLLYENRSRIDGLEGVFGKVKRGIIEDKAVCSLESVLQRFQRSLDARAPKPATLRRCRLASNGNGHDGEFAVLKSSCWL